MNSFRIITIFLLSAFYVIYITKMLVLKKQNIAGNILGKGRKPKEKLVLEIILKFFSFLMVPIQFGSVVFNDFLYGLHFHPVIRIFGLSLLFSGNLIFCIAVITMRNNWRAGYSFEQDTKLVTKGIYKISRNPAFVGFDLLYIGGAFAYPNILNFSFTIVLLILFHVQILGEEKFLIEKFGEPYLLYKNKVRRYL